MVETGGDGKSESSSLRDVPARSGDGGEVLVRRGKETERLKKVGLGKSKDAENRWSGI